MLSKVGRNPSGTSWQRNVPLYEINARRPPLASEIACYASHRAVWCRCVELGDPVVVLEDDFRLLPSFASALPRLAALTREFGFIRIQSLQRARRRFIPNVVRNDRELARHYLADVPLCMLAYSISPSAAAALIEGSACLKAPVDRFMQRTWEHGVPLGRLRRRAFNATQLRRLGLDSSRIAGNSRLANTPTHGHEIGA